MHDSREEEQKRKMEMERERRRLRGDRPTGGGSPDPSGGFFILFLIVIILNILGHCGNGTCAQKWLNENGLSDCVGEQKNP